jgi:hypothetical protein
MTPGEAQRMLTGVDVVPCRELPLADARRLVEACLAEGVAALVHREACSKPSCSPKFQVLVRPEDAPQVETLLRRHWSESLAREGFAPVEPRLTAVAEDGEPPCPACGTAAPLVEGACSDCGLQLE